MWDTNFLFLSWLTFILLIYSRFTLELNICSCSVIDFEVKNLKIWVIEIVYFILGEKRNWNSMSGSPKNPIYLKIFEYQNFKIWLEIPLGFIFYSFFWACMLQRKMFLENMSGFLIYVIPKVFICNLAK